MPHHRYVLGRAHNLGANSIVASLCYLGTNANDVDLIVYFFWNETGKSIFVKIKSKKLNYKKKKVSLPGRPRTCLVTTLQARLRSCAVVWLPAFVYLCNSICYPDHAPGLEGVVGPKSAP